MVARNQVTLIGRLGTAEEWSTRLSFGGVVPGPGPYNTEAEMTSWANTAKAVILANWNVAGNIFKSMLSSEGTVDTMRVDYIAADDKVAASVEVPMAFVGANGIAHPYQTAVCVSLLTGLPGASRRGRSYLPFLTGSLAAPGAQLSSQQRTDIVTMWRGVADALEVNQPDSGRVEHVIASETLQAVTPVTSYSVGSILDTQRRRRNGLVETYTTLGA